MRCFAVRTIQRSVLILMLLCVCVCVFQEIQERMPGLGQRETRGDLGSGEMEDGSGDCDDEDGCQGSGDHADRTGE